MTRKGFHILLASILVVCILSPYVEFALDWNQSIFETGYDSESTIAVIALLLILAFALASLIADFLPDLATSEELLVESHATSRPVLRFIFSIPESSPPLPLRI